MVHPRAVEGLVGVVARRGARELEAVDLETEGQRARGLAADREAQVARVGAGRGVGGDVNRDPELAQIALLDRQGLEGRGVVHRLDVVVEGLHALEGAVLADPDVAVARRVGAAHVVLALVADDLDERVVVEQELRRKRRGLASAAEVGVPAAAAGEPALDDTDVDGRGGDRRAVGAGEARRHDVEGFGGGEGIEHERSVLVFAGGGGELHLAQTLAVVRQDEGQALPHVVGVDREREAGQRRQRGRGGRGGELLRARREVRQREAALLEAHPVAYVRLFGGFKLSDTRRARTAPVREGRVWHGRGRGFELGRRGLRFGSGDLHTENLGVGSRGIP